ncbi:hypothetical protein G4B88_001680 [Cannabis sativa]|uniref:Reverse transcriptase zinc-binding domain-containing protein n=1 Tax=Cannabis sativa TaxID=3483 RepID=A0A7J6I256_CANSA|nr:hypothetical protein G4B88_001680 [Cannabis sativa]
MEDEKFQDLRQAHDNREWDTAFINKVFNEDDANVILSIPSSNEHLSDKVLGHYTTNGEYSVKNGYKLAFDSIEKTKASDMLGTELLWNELWKSRIPYNIKHFLRKLSHSWLPTNHVLFCRKFQINPSYPRCGGSSNEDNVHAIWRCSATIAT